MQKGVLFAVCAWFALAGWVLIPYVGIQNDETLFAAGIYQPIGLEHGITVFGRTIATMLVSFHGALKTWLYLPIFWLWPPSAYSVRVPMVMAGALTIWLFYRLAARLLDSRAALAAAALLGTDVTFLLTTTFDWGPVALQHLLGIGGLLALVRFHETGRALFLALGFGCFGLAMWDKAVFAWTLAGLAAAGLLCAARPILRHVTARNAAIAAAAFCLGAAPLIRHNVKFGFPTFRDNARISASGAAGKVVHLRRALDGTALFGYLAPDSPAQPPGAPRTALERASVALAAAVGSHPAGSLAVLAAALLLPFAGRTRRTGLFALVAGGVTWLMMALTVGAGAGTHHVVLAWPFLQLLVAAVFFGVLERLRGGIALFTILAVLLCASSVLVLNRHLSMLVRGGTTPFWTDAIDRLSDYVRADPQRTIYAMDWGFADSLRMLHRGRLRILMGWPAFQQDAGAAARAQMLGRMLADDNAIFIRHVPGKAVLHAPLAEFDSAVQAAGYRQEPLQVIHDRLGRPQFQVFRLVRPGGIS